MYVQAHVQHGLLPHRVSPTSIWARDHFYIPSLSRLFFSQPLTRGRMTPSTHGLLQRREQHTGRPHTMIGVRGGLPAQEDRWEGVLLDTGIAKMEFGQRRKFKSGALHVILPQTMETSVRARSVFATGKRPAVGRHGRKSAWSLSACRRPPSEIAPQNSILTHHNR